MTTEKTDPLQCGSPLIFIRFNSNPNGGWGLRRSAMSLRLFETQENYQPSGQKISQGITSENNVQNSEMSIAGFSLPDLHLNVTIMLLDVQLIICFVHLRNKHVTSSTYFASTTSMYEYD